MNENEKKYTQEQAQFYVAMKELDKMQVLHGQLEELIKTVTLEDPRYNMAKQKIIEVEKRIDLIKTSLWKKIQLYAISEMNHMMSAYNVTISDRNDILQDMALIFYEKLPNYNPKESTPTTYFSRYFREKISKTLRSNYKKLTQYDAANVRKINRVIADYEQRGIAWTQDMIVTRTGLSPKVVKATIFYARNSKTANIEDAAYLKSPVPTPEEALDEKEKREIIIAAINRCTTSEEKELLFRRINQDGHKEKPYEKIAEETSLPVRQVKAIINGAICKLNQDDELRSRFGHKNQYTDFQPMKLQDNSIDIMEQQLLDELNQFNNFLHEN